MKKLHSFISILLLLSTLNAQTTITLKCSKDAAIGYHDGYNTAGVNFGNAIQNAAYSIPAFGGVGVNNNRGLIDFSLSSIPAGATIVSATLNLYAIGPIGAYPGHSGLNNTSSLKRIVQNWQENTVTWNNQPLTSNQNSIQLNNSISPTQNYVNIDVTAMVKDMINDSLGQHGFLLSLVNEAPTNILAFASKNHPDTNLVPTLVIIYNSLEITQTLTADYDAAIGFHDGNPINTANLNYGGAFQNAAYAVPSAFGQGLNGNRALIHFDLSSIPSNATITSAKLDLYSISQIGSFPAHGGSNNNVLVERVLAPWTEYGVTWSNQPQTTSLNAQTLIGTNNPNQDYLDIDVTALINDMRAANANHGIKLRLGSQVATNLLSFCSEDYPDSTKHPKLRVSFTLSNSLSSPSTVQKIEQVFKIYPNPTNSILNLNYNLNQYKNASFQLFDVQGKLVYQTALNTMDSKASLSLDRLDNGLYFGKIYADGILVKTEKIVKRN